MKKYLAVPAFILVPADDIPLDGNHFMIAINRITSKYGNDVIIPCPGELAEWEFGTREEIEQAVEEY